jgi:hypothetical protein
VKFFLLRKWLPFILIVILGIAVLLVKSWKNARKTAPKTDQNNSSQRKLGNGKFDRNISYLEYSKHASCRMDCRQISVSEVETIIRNGSINYNKSDIGNARCPRYALEGRTADNQRVRIVFAQCRKSTVVVTVIDLDKEWVCDCPGDE